MEARPLCALDPASGADNGCDFFRWCDEAASLGPLHLDLTDLVDDRHSPNEIVGADSVRRALVRFTEAIYFLNVIAFETELKAQGKQQPQDAGCGGDTAWAKACGEPMSTCEVSLLQVMKALPHDTEITLNALRNTARLGRAAMSSRQLSATQFDEVCQLAASLGLADVCNRRCGATGGRQQRVLVKRALTEVTKKVAENLHLPFSCFPVP